MVNYAEKTIHITSWKQFGNGRSPKWKVFRHLMKPNESETPKSLEIKTLG